MQPHQRRHTARDRIVDAEIMKLELRKDRLRAAHERDGSETPTRARRTPAPGKGRSA